MLRYRSIASLASKRKKMTTRKCWLVFSWWLRLLYRVRWVMTLFYLKYLKLMRFLCMNNSISKCCSFMLILRINLRYSNTLIGATRNKCYLEIVQIFFEILPQKVCSYLEIVRFFVDKNKVFEKPFLCASLIKFCFECWITKQTLVYHVFTP